MRHITRLAELDARGQASEKDLRDARGQFFTPVSVAQTLVKHSLCALGGQDTIRLVDPFCGDGRLCTEAIRQLANGPASRRVEVHLWEIHEEMLDVAEAAVQQALRDSNLMGSVVTFSGDSFAHGSSGEQHFDLVITNPPWDAIKPDRRMLDRLPPDEREDYLDHLRHEDEALCARYPEAAPAAKFAGWGTNLSRVGLALSLRLAPRGVVGIVMPSSLFADTTYPRLRSRMVADFDLVRVDTYQAEAKLFPGVDVPFASVVLNARHRAQQSDAKQRPNRFPVVRHLPRGKSSRITVCQPSPDQEEWNLPLTVSALSPSVTARLHPLPTWEQHLRDEGCWAGRELDETGLKARLCESGVPFVKGKDVERYSFAHDERSFIALEEAERASSYHTMRLVWRDVSRPSQRRRLQAALLPPGYVTGNSLGVLSAGNSAQSAAVLYWFLGIMNSATFEAQLRTVLATGHVTLTSLRKMRVPEPFVLGTEIRELAEQQVAAYSDSRQAELEGIVARSYGLTERQLVSLMRSHNWLGKDDLDLCLTAFREH